MTSKSALTQIGRIEAQEPEVLERDYSKGGRKSKSNQMAGIQQRLNYAAEDAAIILEKHIQQRKRFKTLHSGLQRACEYVIDHAIGKARIKTEAVGGILTYAQLAQAAEQLEHKPREILAEVEEISRKVTFTIREQAEPLQGVPLSTRETSKSGVVNGEVVEDTILEPKEAPGQQADETEQSQEARAADS